MEFCWCLDIYDMDYELHALLYEGTYYPNVKLNQIRLQELSLKEMSQEEQIEYTTLYEMLLKQESIYLRTNAFIRSY